MVSRTMITVTLRRAVVEILGNSGVAEAQRLPISRTRRTLLTIMPMQIEEGQRSRWPILPFWYRDRSGFFS
jgi:hypothetical protein